MRTGFVLRERYRNSNILNGLDHGVRAALLDRVEQGVVALDERAQQLGRGAGAGEAQGQGVDDGVGQAAPDGRGPCLLLGLAGRQCGAGAGGSLPPGRGVLAGPLGVDLVGVGVTGRDERGEQRPAHLEVDTEALEGLGAVEQRPQPGRVVARRGEGRGGADELQLGVAARLGGHGDLPEPVAGGRADRRAVLGGRVGVHGRQQLGDQGAQQGRVGLTRQGLEHDVDEVAGAHLGVAGHVPQRGQHQGARQGAREAAGYARAVASERSSSRILA